MSNAHPRDLDHSNSTTSNQPRPTSSGEVDLLEDEQDADPTHNDSNGTGSLQVRDHLGFQEILDGWVQFRKQRKVG